MYRHFNDCLEPLARAVASNIESGRIGGPVFLRWTVLADTLDGGIESAICAMASKASDWMGSPLRSLFAMASSGCSTITVLADFPAGQTALLTAGRAHGRPEIDFTLLGENGALYHHDLPQFVPQGNFDADRCGRDELILEMVRDSLRSGSPVSWKRSGQ